LPPHPFEVDAGYLESHLDALIDVTFRDIQSQFLLMPHGPNFMEFATFQDAYEVLKQETGSFERFDDETVWKAMRRNGLVFVVIRTILGVSPPEWAELAQTERKVDIPQNVARQLDTRCRREATYFSTPLSELSRQRVEALVSVAVDYITRGAPPGAADVVHRLNKIDSAEGLVSLRHAANQHVPYAVLLYERYLGRPFASHRDSVSELVGDVMESAIEERLAKARITFRKTRRAERVPGFEQAPDFFIPTEVAPAAIIEAKITGDDGTARDKVSRVLNLATMRDKRERDGHPTFELIACIDGRGFRVRREDMRKMLLATRGKVFTLATLDRLIDNSRLCEFLPRPS